MKRMVVDIEDPARGDPPTVLAAAAFADPDASIALHHNLFDAKIDGGGDRDELVDEARELLLQSREQKLQEISNSHFDSKATIQLMWSEHGWQELIRYAIGFRADLVIAESSQQSGWKRLRLGRDDWQLIRHCPMPVLLAREASPKRYRRVVAAVDPMHTHDKPAELDQVILRHAAAVASAPQATVDVINVVAPVMTIPPSTMTTALPMPDQTDELLEAHRDRVNELIDSGNTTVQERHVVVGNPADEIVDYVNERHADLVVMGAVSRSRLNRLLIGSTAERVLDHVPCDFLIVKPPNFDVRLPALASLAGQSAGVF